MSQKYSLKLHFAHPERITFPKVEPFNGRVIASLTSWTKRISTAHLAVQTILVQSRQPDLTVLYLAEEEFPNREKDLPRELLALRSDKFEIHWVNNIGSYKKLIPALKEFPDDIIITFDDDIFYHQETVVRLLDGYEKFPSCIQCHVGAGHYFVNGKKMARILLFYDYPTYLNDSHGSGAVLYPPHCFKDDIFNEELFMKYLYNQDDAWINLMANLSGCRVNAVENNITHFGYNPSAHVFGINGSGDATQKAPSASSELMKQFYDQFYPNCDEILRQEWLNAKPD